MLNPKLIAICHTCPFNDKTPVNGKLVCRADDSGRDILVHVSNGTTCPKGFHDGIPNPVPAHRLPLAGDLVAAVTEKFGIDRIAKFVAKLAGKKDCGCAARQQWLNRLHERIRRLLAH